MKKYTKSILLALLLCCSLSTWAQRFTDKIDRGLVAVPSGLGGNLVSWRVWGEEYYDVTYNLYCNGSKIATNLKTSNYRHSTGTATSRYRVAAVVRGVEQTASAEITRWENGRWEIPVQPILGRDGTDVTAQYTLNDVSLGDLNGDGVVEFIVKRPCGISTDAAQSNCFHVLDCYDMQGNRLWWIDMGPNMQAAADEQWDCVCYDWDQDGKAEVLLRGADNMFIHHADGTTTKIGSSADTRPIYEYTHTGNEYLLYLEGATGKPYAIGPSAHPNYMVYPNPRGTSQDWGDDYGHRATKHYFAAPFFDGRKASIFLGRGCYTKHMMKAYDVDPATHKLTLRWSWDNAVSGPWFGQGYHNFQVADVDWDGRDEIVFGSMILDDNGKGLSTTGLGHGDAQHCSDLDPYRKYQEQFACNESAPAMNYRNACTSEFYYRVVATGDDGRALCANFTDDYPGSQGRSVSTGWISGTADKELTALAGDNFISWADLNQRLYWDGDLCDEYFDSPGTEGYGAVYRPASSTVAGGRWNFTESKCNNWSKNNPGAIADIFGDWREEVVMRKSDNTALLIYTTGESTTYRIPTLWHDHQYRNAMVWQSMGYNQPPHKSYFLGKLEGITTAPAPLTMTGRTEVKNGGTIGTTDQHLIVCETNDTEIKITEGASPYILTFNVPSWVQGTAGDHTTNKKPTINYHYYTCNVSGGGLSGSTRLIKQGDGILTLPATHMTHTGETHIWAGTLNFDGTMKNSSLWLNRFAELNSKGTFRSIKADYASVIRPGAANTYGTLTTDTLIWGFGARIQIDLSDNTAKGDKLNTKYIRVEEKTGDAWVKFGPKYITPLLEVVSHIEGSASELPAGDYILGDASAVTGNLNSVKIEGLDGLKKSLRIADGKLILTIEGTRDPATIYWTGAQSNIWDFANTQNFTFDGSASYFVSQDNVVFDDNASQFSLKLTGELDPDTVFVDADNNYTWGGGGAITGTASMVKTGTGTLTIETANTNTGKTLISGGTVEVASLSHASLAAGALGAVGTAADHITIENGATLRTTGTVTMGSPIKARTPQGGTIQNTGAFYMNSSFSGTQIIKNGNGWMTLYANSASLDTLTVMGGGLSAQCATPAKVLKLQSGTTDLAQNNSTPIHVPAGRTATLNCQADRGTYSNKLTGSGTLNLSYPLVVGSGWYADRCHFTGNWSAFEGTIVASSADGRFCLNNSYGMPKGTFHLGAGVILQNTAKTFSIGKVTGSGSLGGNCTLGGSVSGNNVWQVGNDEDYTLSALVIDNAAFTKAGSGKITVNQAWTTTGAIRINAGTLLLKSGACLGTGTLVVTINSKLVGTTKSTVPLTNTTVTISGTLQPGLSETSASGMIYFGGKNVTFSRTGTLVCGLRKCLTVNASTGKATMGNAYLSQIGTLRFYDGATIAPFLDSSYQPTTDEAVADSFLLWTDVNKVTVPDVSQLQFQLPELPLGNYWDTSRFAEGLLFVRYDSGLADGITPVPHHEKVNVRMYAPDGKLVATWNGLFGHISGDCKQHGEPNKVYLLKIKKQNGETLTMKMKN